MEQNLIPPKIHYCWFGKKPLPQLALKCIKSWKKYFPDYDIIEWNEDNYDVNIIPYTADAYKAGKYAFVSDYARFWILYKYGGVYFDTDVEVIKPMNDIIQRGAFMGRERVLDNNDPFIVAPGLGIGAEAGHPFYKILLDKYQSLSFSFNKSETPTVVDITTEEFVKRGMTLTNEVQQVANIWLYPADYFDPRDFYDEKKIYLTENTRSIHHYAASWLDRNTKIRNWIIARVGPQLTSKIRKIKHFFKLGSC